MSEISSDLFRLRGPSSTCFIFTRCILCGELCGTESAATPWAGLYFDWRSRLCKGAFCKLAWAEHENLEFPCMFQRWSTFCWSWLQALVVRNARSGSNSEVSCLDHEKSQSDGFAGDAVKDSSYGSFSTASLVGWMVSLCPQKMPKLGLSLLIVSVATKKAGMQVCQGYECNESKYE